MEPLYIKIRELREKIGMSQQELAELTGYTSRSSIAKIEKGEVDLPQSKIALIAKALKTTPSKLMGWDKEDDSLGNYEDNVEYLTANYPDLIELYNEIRENDQLVILFDKAKKLEPQDLAQILKIIDTFNKESK